MRRSMTILVRGILAASTLLAGSTAWTADDPAFAERIRPLLAKFCVDCHGGKAAKGGLRLDTLTPDFETARALVTWETVLARLTDTTEEVMPPPGKPRPTADEVIALRGWVETRRAESTAASLARQKVEGRTEIRRLNRVEYNNTLRDLLGIDLDLKPLLPDDESVAGFDNVGSGLQITRIHQERYLEAAEVGLNAAIVTGPRPKSSSQRFFYTKADYPPRRILDNGSVVFFTSAAADLQRSRVPATGRYRVRVSAHTYRNGDRPLIVHVNCGNPTHPDQRYLTVPGKKPTVMEFEARMGVGSTVRIAPYGFGQFYIRDLAAYQGPGLVVDWVEIEGPLTDAWPPHGHRRLLGDLDLKAATVADAERVLRTFVPRAFRRPVPDTKIEKFTMFLRGKVEHDRCTVEDALRQSLIAVLCSPDFLLLREAPGPLDDYALASRLSYFLWRSLPDQELLDCAEKKDLRSPVTLQRQVNRMLTDPRAAAFPEQFLGQWLGLRQIDATTPDKLLYPEYDEYLRHSMLQEPLRFFGELLRDDLPIPMLIASDFSVVNGRLAQHYGIRDVEGPEFRRVSLPSGSHRGGVLTMAAVLKVTANGTVTSPVVRGAWVRDRILGQPLALPADLNVPAVEPDIRGALNIRAQLAKHRTDTQCAGCHQKMDPLGFALEAFDPIGGFRTHYRALGKYPKAPVKVFGKPVEYSNGLTVDCGDVLPDGQAFRDSDEFKQLLRKDPAPFVRTIAEKLLVYATGSPVLPADRPAIDELLRRLHEKKGGLRKLVHEIVQSELFLHK